jgi:hypothetical protein
MQLPESLAACLRSPTAAGAWELRGDLLARGLDPDHAAFRLLAELNRFLDRLETGIASRTHSERASIMDIGAFGGTVASELAEAEDAAELAERLLAGAITEGLAVLATRQHVKAWRGELASVYREAAWFLFDELWYWAARRKPELDADERRRLIDLLLAPARDESSTADDRERTVILCSLFLLLLVDSLADISSSRA